jgi:hypothetical protein
MSAHAASTGGLNKDQQKEIASSLFKLADHHRGVLQLDVGPLPAEMQNAPLLKAALELVLPNHQTAFVITSEMLRANYSREAFWKVYLEGMGVELKWKAFCSTVFMAWSLDRMEDTSFMQDIARLYDRTVKSWRHTILTISCTITAAELLRTARDGYISAYIDLCRCAQQFEAHWKMYYQTAVLMQSK